MKIKVIKASHFGLWYADKIGEIFEVRESVYGYILISNSDFSFDESDCEIVQEEKCKIMIKMQRFLKL